MKIPPSSKTVEINCRRRKDGRFNLTLSLLSDNETAVFVEMCRDLLTAAEDARDESTALKNFWQRYRHWQNLFAAAQSDLLSEERQRGLIGELLFLRGLKEAFFEGTSPKGYHNKMRVDGFLTDEADNSIALFVVHYTDGNENMTKTLAEKNFKLLESFANAVLTTLKNRPRLSSLPRL